MYKLIGWMHPIRLNEISFANKPFCPLMYTLSTDNNVY